MCCVGCREQKAASASAVTNTTPAPRQGVTAPALALALGNGVNMEFVLIRPGSFVMGSDKTGAKSDEKPVHQVTITKPFYMGKYEVTQEQWIALMKNNPSLFKGTKNPVDRVTWNECQDFIQKLNAVIASSERRGSSSAPLAKEDQVSGFSLPSEAQWEYACSAGSSTEFCYGDADAGLDGYAWFMGNSGFKSHPVGKKKPNAWGLYDMHGNVWEWCSDRYGAYTNAAATDPIGPASGAKRVLRGGSADDYAGGCRSASRSRYFPAGTNTFTGFRVVFVQ